MRSRSELRKRVPGASKYALTAIGAAALVTFGANSQQAVQQAPTPLQSNTHAVLISVAVRDSTGQVISDLRRQDFTVTDEGKPRDFRMFPTDDGAPVVHPLGVVVPGVFSNRNVLGESTGRVTTILLDAINTAFTDQASAKAQAIKAVKEITPGDNIAIYSVWMPGGSTSGIPSLSVLQDYTTDKALLIKALQDYTPHLPTGVGAAESGGPFRADNNRQLPAVQRSNPQLQQLQRMNRLDATLETLRLIATHMTGATHRNSIIWITSGYPPVNEENAQMQAALAAINDANIAIYPIDARGLSASANAYINIQTMQAFAEETGGQAYFNRNDIDHEIQEAISDPQSTYLLGFYLSDHDLDGKFHKLKVTVDRPGLTLHYRAGYTASADPNLRRAAAEPIDTQMLSFLDSAAIGIQAQVARENDASRKSLKVSLSLDRNTLGLKAGQQQVNLVEMFAEIDNQGQIVARITQSVRFDMPAPNRDPGYDQTIREQEGATRLRVFVQDKATGRTGSLTIPLADISAN
jgi:VWFA-related protein